MRKNADSHPARFELAAPAGIASSPAILIPQVKSHVGARARSLRGRVLSLSSASRGSALSARAVTAICYRAALR